jgi:hypothetical protein
MVTRLRDLSHIRDKHGAVFSSSYIDVLRRIRYGNM